MAENYCCRLGEKDSDLTE